VKWKIKSYFKYWITFKKKHLIITADKQLNLANMLTDLVLVLWHCFSPWRFGKKSCRDFHHPRDAIKTM